MLQKEWQEPAWRDDDQTSLAEPPPPPPPLPLPLALPLPQPPHGLGKISEQKGILGPGPADLRFSEALWPVVWWKQARGIADRKGKGQAAYSPKLVCVN